MTEKEIKQTIDSIADEKEALVFGVVLEASGESITKTQGTQEKVAMLIAMLMHENGDLIELVKFFSNKLQNVDYEDGKAVLRSLN